MWEGKVFVAADADADADADAAETDWKHKVTPERGDLITGTEAEYYQMLDAQKTLFMNTCEKTDHVITALHCIAFPFKFIYAMYKSATHGLLKSCDIIRSMG